jgi:hypothetical protein
LFLSTQYKIVSLAALTSHFPSSDKDPNNCNCAEGDFLRDYGLKNKFTVPKYPCLLKMNGFGPKSF